MNDGLPLRQVLDSTQHSVLQFCEIPWRVLFINFANDGDGYPDLVQVDPELPHPGGLLQMFRLVLNRNDLT